MNHTVEELEHGARVKRRNEVVSFCVLGVAGAILFHSHSFTAVAGIISFLSAFVWSNWIEYVYHRWLDHDSVFGTFFLKRHEKHHQKPRSGCHINFGENPIWTLSAYAINVAPVVALDIFKVHTGFSSVVLATYVLYVVAIEDIHWRVHINKWLPFRIGRRHLQHHGVETKNFNVAIPLFDFIFRTLK